MFDMTRYVREYAGPKLFKGDLARLRRESREGVGGCEGEARLDASVAGGRARAREVARPPGQEPVSAGSGRGGATETGGGGEKRGEGHGRRSGGWTTGIAAHKVESGLD